LAFADERLPRPLITLRERLIERDGPTATKTWMAVLRLAQDSSLSALSDATEVALSLGTLDPQAIALVLRQRSGADSERIDLRHHQTPALHAQAVSLDEYRIAALVEHVI
jgi:hypothetical protein